MKHINNFILERLVLNKNKKKKRNDIEFNPCDSTLGGVIQLSKDKNGDEFRFHKIYNPDGNIIAWTETWKNNGNNSNTILIVQDDVYEYLLRFVSDYDPECGFDIVKRKNKLYKYIFWLWIIDGRDTLYLAPFNDWRKSRESIFKKQFPSLTGSFTNIAQEIENTLI